MQSDIIIIMFAFLLENLNDIDKYASNVNYLSKGYITDIIQTLSIVSITLKKDIVI